jgi:SMC interacting uncharacterized protein involved in chromosome segregation
MVASMANNPGWEIVKEFIVNNMKALESRIFDEDLSKEQFDVLKAERNGLKKVLDFVERRVNKLSREF